MNRLIMAAMISFISFTTLADENNKQVNLSRAILGGALGQISDANLAGDLATKFINRVIDGSENEDDAQTRISIAATTCEKSSVASSLASCSVSFFFQDLADIENGGEITYILNYELDSNGKVTNASFDAEAGAG